MKNTARYLLLPLLLCSTFSSSAQNDSLMHFLSPFIGEWHLMQPIAGGPGIKFEWAHENRQLLRLCEGIPRGVLDERTAEALVVGNPHSGKVEFLGQILRNGILVKGRFEPIENEKGFVRYSDFYFPKGEDTRSFRSTCRLTAPDTMECISERLVDGKWQIQGYAMGPKSLLVRRPPGREIPQWILEDWESRSRDNGIWIADNSVYQSEQEPFDAYGLEWTSGLGGKHLTGRLFLIKDGKDVGTAWQFTEYWDPASGEIRVVQIGSDGTVGQGKIWRDNSGRIKEVQTYVSPAGGSFRTGHLMWMENGEHHTQSFDIVNGEWEERRFYIWKREGN